MKFIAVLLRLADILDFDKDRAPDSLYKTIHFTSSVSINEWEKHKSVCGWQITPELIRYDMKCSHPIYQRVALQFMDWIDSELSGAHDLVNKFPSSVSRYCLNIPLKVDRSRIVPKDDNYIYHDLEFSLSRDEIVKLLMTDSLYESSSICIRELLQNSLDALKYRSAVFKRDTGIKLPEGKVVFKHTLDEYNREVVICSDNGIGMDENIITKFLTKAGRSYYKSPEFQREQVTLKTKGIDFNPCSQFGIGFMSCFMLGDNIIIETRRDYGYEKGKGKSLLVEINGLNGIIVIKEGKENQPVGTTVKIIGRTKPTYLDAWADKVKLIDTLDAYALACEFPIEGECTIEEIKDSINIAPTIAISKTLIEDSGINKMNYKTFEQDLSEINHNLGGKIRVSLLTNKEGKYVLENEEALWKKEEKSLYHEFFVKSNMDRTINYKWGRDRTCCDGILVCGTPGRTHENHSFGMRSNVIKIGNESLTLDIRGEIKPQLTPSRIPKETGYNRDISWIKIQRYISEAEGRMWDKIAMSLNTVEEIKIFLKLVELYRVKLDNMSYDIIWNKLYVPIEVEQNKVQWEKISNLNTIKILEINNKIQLYAVDNWLVKADDGIKKYDDKCYGAIKQANLFYAILAMTSVRIENDEIVFKIEKPEGDNIWLGKYFIQSSDSKIRLLPYKGKLKDYFIVETPIVAVNKYNSLAKYAFDNQYNRDVDSILQFAISLICFLCNKDNISDLINENVSQALYRMGCLYKDIHWEDYDKKLAPPYKIWTKEKGTLIIEEKDFIKWAETKPSSLNGKY